MVGIDVSHHNGEIAWNKVKIDFALIRTGYGKKNPNQVDKEFERNYMACKKYHIPCGAYHYSYAKTIEDAEKEADFVLELLKGKKFEFPIYFDMEEKFQVNLGKAKCTAMFKAFADKLEEAGYWVGIYSFDSFFQTNLEDGIEKRYTAWVARVENIKPNSCKPAIWQYSWKGRVEGINGDVDMNKCDIDYPSMIKKAHKNGY